VKAKIIFSYMMCIFSYAMASEIEKNKPIMAMVSWANTQEAFKEYAITSIEDTNPLNLQYIEIESMGHPGENEVYFGGKIGTEKFEVKIKDSEYMNLKNKFKDFYSKYAIAEQKEDVYFHSLQWRSLKVRPSYIEFMNEHCFDKPENKNFSLSPIGIIEIGFFGFGIACLICYVLGSASGK
jgi:hypothetical protein